MAAPASPSAVSGQDAIPALLLNACFVLAVINVAFFPGAYLAHFWIFDGKGLGIPTDFVNVWSAGKLALDGHPALAWDWDVQKQVQVAVLGQSYPGNFAWHYPPPFLFVALLLAHFPYGAAFAGWALASLVPYLAMMRAVTGKVFGLLLGLAFPVVLTNTLVGQNGFLTASLISRLKVSTVMPQFSSSQENCDLIHSLRWRTGLCRSPNSAVPMRTRVEPSSMATSKSPLMPMLSWGRGAPSRCSPSCFNSRSFWK